MENKIIITNYNGYNLILDTEELIYNEYIGEDFFEYGFEDCGSWEQVEEVAFENLWSYIDNMVPVYYKDIKEQFNSLDHRDIDELIENNCIEYDGDFSKFQQAIIFYSMYEEASKELWDALESMEEEEEEEELEEFDEYGISVCLLGQINHYLYMPCISAYAVDYMIAYQENNQKELNEFLEEITFKVLTQFNEYSERELELEEFLENIDFNGWGGMKDELYRYFRKSFTCRPHDGYYYLSSQELVDKYKKALDYEGISYISSGNSITIVY